MEQILLLISSTTNIHWVLLKCLSGLLFSIIWRWNISCCFTSKTYFLFICFYLRHCKRAICCAVTHLMIPVWAVGRKNATQVLTVHGAPLTLSAAETSARTSCLFWNIIGQKESASLLGWHSQIRVSASLFCFFWSPVNMRLPHSPTRIGEER